MGTDNIYLDELIKSFEVKIKDAENHPFKIIEFREHGYLVKIYGLIAYVSFNHMPWKYANVSAWKSIFHH